MVVVTMHPLLTQVAGEGELVDIMVVPEDLDHLV
jgi:hypothetical protein